MTQPDLFSPPSGRELAIDGARRASDHADAETPSWSDVAFGYVRLFARRGTEFMTEDIRVYAETHGFARPPDGRAWGSAVTRAVRAGLITRTGYAPMKSPNCHANPKSVWRGTDKARGR